MDAAGTLEDLSGRSRIEMQQTRPRSSCLYRVRVRRSSASTPLPELLALTLLPNSLSPFLPTCTSLVLRSVDSSCTTLIAETLPRRADRLAHAQSQVTGLYLQSNGRGSLVKYDAHRLMSITTCSSCGPAEVCGMY